VFVSYIVAATNKRRSIDGFESGALSVISLISREEEYQSRSSGGEVPNIALNEGEDVLCVFAGTTLLEPRAVRTWRSNYGGPSFRIAKGVSFRLGASSGVSESHEEMRAVDIGTLILTNERLSFVGSRRTIDVPLEKIIDVDNEGYSDWLRLNRQGKQKTECFQLNSALYTYFNYNGEQLLAQSKVGCLN
jgi:hypothetical protein